jgi:competence protein ComEC
MYDRPVTALIVGFVAGIALHTVVALGWSFALLFLICGGCLALDYSCRRFSWLLFLALGLIGMGLGLLRYDFSGPRLAPTVPVDERVTARGVIDREPDEREQSTRLVVRIDEINQAPVAPFLTYVTLPTYPKYLYGDRVSMHGTLEVPSNFDPAFDWVGYLKKEGVSYQMVQPKVTLIGHNAGNLVKTKLFAFKNRFLGHLNRLVPDPHAAFLGSLLVGSKASPLGDDLTEQFRRAGVSHVVSLSGYNLTIVADTVMKLLRRLLTQRASFFFGALGVVLFTIMAGASATIVRAAIMSVIVIFARVSGRTLDMTRALIAAAVLMLIQNPRILLSDLSFQLSFLATLGIIYGPPILEPKLSWVPTWKWFDLRGTITSTLSAELAVLPILLYQMGTFSVVGLFTNVLILPFIPVTMLAGFMTGSVGFILSVLALPFAYLSYGLLSYELTIVHFFSGLPFAQVELHLSLVALFVCYGVLAVVTYRATKKIGEKPVEGVVDNSVDRIVD